jgi:hypothetical protein
MAHKTWTILCLLLAMCYLVLTPACSVWAETETPRTGTATGLLTAKGEGWIMVRADGANESSKLMPRWVGGTPQQGGGLDKQMLATFRELKVGSRIEVKWLLDEHLRALSVKVLSPSQDDGPGDTDEQQQNDQHGDGNVQDTNGQNQQSDGRSGTLLGTVTAKGEGWIAIRPDGERESYKFFARWVGGTPQQGGGLDRQILQAIAQAPVGVHVQAQWVRDGQRFYLLSLTPAPQQGEDDGGQQGEQ